MPVASVGNTVPAAARMLRRAAASRAAFRVPARREIESDSGQKERNWKVDQDTCCACFASKRPWIKGIHTAYSTTTLPVIFG